jgi:hypothetical protein
MPVVFAAGVFLGMILLGYLVLFAAGAASVGLGAGFFLAACLSTLVRVLWRILIAVLGGILGAAIGIYVFMNGVADFSANKSMTWYGQDLDASVDIAKGMFLAGLGLLLVAAAVRLLALQLTANPSKE